MTAKPMAQRQYPVHGDVIVSVRAGEGNVIHEDRVIYTHRGNGEAKHAATQFALRLGRNMQVAVWMYDEGRSTYVRMRSFRSE